MLSIDPSSPFTEGALLGDRIRLAEHFLDEGVFIRSMASRGALGGLSEATLQAVLLMDAAGNDDVFIETVGVGQAEIDIIDHADTIVLGPDAGLRRLGPGAEGGRDGDPRRDRREQGQPSAHRQHGARDPRRAGARPETDWKVPIVRTEATEGTGIEELAEAIDRHHAHITEQGTLEERRRRNLRNEVLGLATARMRRELERSALTARRQAPRAAGSGSQAAARSGQRSELRHLTPDT